MSIDNTYTRGMGYILPIPLSLANMTTNVAASTLSAWNAATSYALDAEVIDPITRIIYRSLAAANQGNDPLTVSTKWQARGVENRLRLCDTSMGSVTEYADLIRLDITPGRVVTDLALFGVRAQSVVVTITDPTDGVVFGPKTFSMLRPSGNSHWGYFFHPLEFKSRLLISGLPAYTRAVITVEIKNPGGMVRCAELVAGRSVWLGNTKWRPSIGFDEWSEKERDAWGGWKVAAGGAYSDRMKLEVLVNSLAYERTREQIIAVRAKPVVWIGARGFDALTTYGYIMAFEQLLAAHGISDCSMTINGLETTE